MCIIYTRLGTAPPLAKGIGRTVILSFLLMAAWIVCLAGFFSLGRLYWWFDTWWLGVVLACGIGFLRLTALVEVGRSNPMLDFGWIFSRENLHLAGVLLVFRGVSSEPSSPAVSLYQQLGLLNDQQFVRWGIV